MDDGRSLTGTGPRGGLCTAVDARTDQPVPKLADRMWPCSPCIVCMYNTAAHTAHAGHGTHGASHRAKSLQGMAAAVSIRSVLSLILAGGDTTTALVGSGRATACTGARLIWEGRLEWEANRPALASTAASAPPASSNPYSNSAPKRYRWHEPCCKLGALGQLVSCAHPWNLSAEFPRGDPHTGAAWSKA